MRRRAGTRRTLRDDGQHVVEVVRDAAGEPADRLHLLLLVDAVLQVALRGGLQRVDDGRLAVAVLVLDRRHEKRRRAFAGAGERGFDRRNIALPLTRLADRRLERRPVALGDDERIERSSPFSVPSKAEANRASSLASSSTRANPMRRDRSLLGCSRSGNSK